MSPNEPTPEPVRLDGDDLDETRAEAHPDGGLTIAAWYAHRSKWWPGGGVLLTPAAVARLRTLLAPDAVPREHLRTVLRAANLRCTWCGDKCLDLPAERACERCAPVRALLAPIAPAPSEPDAKFPCARCGYATRPSVAVGGLCVTCQSVTRGKGPDASTFEAEGRRAAARGLPRATSYHGVDGEAWLRGWDAYAREYVALAPDSWSALDEEHRWLVRGLLSSTVLYGGEMDAQLKRGCAAALARFAGPARAQPVPAPAPDPMRAACAREIEALADNIDRGGGTELAAALRGVAEGIDGAPAPDARGVVEELVEAVHVALMQQVDDALARARAPGRVVASVEAEVYERTASGQIGVLGGTDVPKQPVVDFSYYADDFPALAAIPVGTRVRVVVVEEAAPAVESDEP